MVDSWIRGLRRTLGRIWLRVFGWHITGSAPTARKAVVVAYPHTSNLDFPFTLAICWALGLNIRWLGKKSLFRFPLGLVMRGLGGIRVDRTRNERLVDAVANLLKHRDDLLVIIPPEGTRSKSGRWRTGFYWVAVNADVPIIPAFLDFARKTGGFTEPVVPSGEPERDLPEIRTRYQGIKGRHPEKQGEITFIEDSYTPPAERSGARLAG